MKKLLLLLAIVFLNLAFTWTASASTYDIYVDQNSTSSTEDGSQENPFKTISAAISEAEKKDSEDQRDIFISNGTYHEEIKINASMTLTGEDKKLTIIDGDGASNTIEIDETSEISNLTVQGGNVGIYVSEDAGAKIKSCKILEAKKIGIEIEKSSTSSSKEVEVTKCEIADGDGKGFYIKKRKVLIEDNEVIDNEEEGIDIRAGVKGKIKKNTISKNGESGIELIVGGSKLKITGNEIKSNSASGIANQFYKDSKKLGSIEIEKNKVQKNDNYGILCSTPSGGDPKSGYWTKSIDLIRNIFNRNGKTYATRCGFPMSMKN